MLGRVQLAVLFEMGVDLCVQDSLDCATNDEGRGNGSIGRQKIRTETVSLVYGCDVRNIPRIRDHIKVQNFLGHGGEKLDMDGAVHFKIRG